MVYGTGTLTGTYQRMDGTPAFGSVLIAPNVGVIRDAAGDVILSGALSMPLDANGSFTATLPASDSAGLDPTGFTYTVTVFLQHQNMAPVTGITVNTGAALNMADLTPVDPAAPTYTQLVADNAAVAAFVTGAGATRDALVAGYAPIGGTATAAALWTPVTTAGNGAIAFPSYDHVRGTVPANTVDIANVRRDFTALAEATISGWWMVTAEGAGGSNVPFARLFTGSQRLADVYRQNAVGGGADNLWLRTVKAAGGSNYNFTAIPFRLELNRWCYIRATYRPTTGRAVVVINGTTVLDTTIADRFAATTLDRVYLGSHEAGNLGTWEIAQPRIT